MTPTFAAHLSRVAMAAALCALVAPAQAADVKPAAASASQAKAKKADGKKSTAKPSQEAEGSMVNNNPVGKADDGSNGYGTKKPTGPRKPEKQQTGATATTK